MFHEYLEIKVYRLDIYIHSSYICFILVGRRAQKLHGKVAFEEEF